MDTKAWYQSKTIWGAVIAMIASALRLTGIEIGDDLTTVLTDQILNVVSFAGTAYAIYGRVIASKVIAPKTSLP